MTGSNFVLLLPGGDGRFNFLKEHNMLILLLNSNNGGGEYLEWESEHHLLCETNIRKISDNEGAECTKAEYKIQAAVWVLSKQRHPP